MGFSRKLNRAARLKERGNSMRYVQLKVTDEDREKITKRGAGEEQYKTGIFGEVELMRRLLEISPKVTKMEDVTRLLRITRRLEKIEDSKDAVLEIPDDDLDWVKKMLDHDKWNTYGPNSIRIFGELLEKILEATSEPPSKLHRISGESDVKS